MWPSSGAHELGMLDVGSASALILVDPDLGGEEGDSWLQCSLRCGFGRPDLALLRRASGRPSLGAPYHELGVSIARRNGLILAGFAPDRAVGVDLEFEAAVSSAEAVLLAHDHFAPGEAAAMAAQPDPAARDLFLRLWVAKEAALKTTGRGIYDGMDEPDLQSRLTDLVASTVIEVPAGPRVPALLVGSRTWKLGDQSLIYGSLAVCSG